MTYALEDEIPFSKIMRKPEITNEPKSKKLWRNYKAGHKIF